MAAGSPRLFAQDAMESQFRAKLTTAITLSLSEVKPNEVVSRGLTYSGIAVSIWKADNPLQLLNPFAPARYGSWEDNALRDLKTGRVEGWKLFALRF